MVKNILKVFIYGILIILLIEIAARVKLSLTTNDYRYLIYYQGIVKAKPAQDFNQLLIPLRFKEVDNNSKKVIMIGTSVLEAVHPALKTMLENDGWEEFVWIGGREQSSIEYGKHSVIIVETKLLPAIYNDFFNLRNKIKQFLGEPLYSNLYQNSVFFLMLSEKMTGAVSFSTAAKQQFVNESLPVYEETFKNISASGARVFVVNFPNYFLRSGQMAFGIHCGEVADMMAKQLLPLADRYSIAYLDIYTLYNNDFNKDDFRDDFHLHKDGAKKAARYIYQAIKTIPDD